MATKLKENPVSRALAPNQNPAEARQFPEAGIMEGLSIPNTRARLPFLNELALLRQGNAGLAGIYEAGLKMALGKTRPEEFQYMWSANSVAAFLQKSARERVYSHLGMQIMPLSEPVRKIRGMGPPYENDSLFAIACLGRLREEALWMAGLARMDGIELYTVYASTKMYRADVKAGDTRKRVYIDESGVRADMLAASLLEGTGITTPRMKNIAYCMPDGTDREYGALADIADSRGVKEAVSIRALARNEAMSRQVFGRFVEFSEKLGYAFEACRILGIQDMHHRNAYAVRHGSGALGIGRIDLDIVATYPTSERYKEAFVGQLFHILDALYFAAVFGEAVRSRPETIACEIKKVSAKETRAGLESMAQKMFSGFLRGAKEAYGFYSNKEAMEKVRETLRNHNGLPVGWGAGERRTSSMIRKKNRLLEESLRAVESAYINGRIPEYISRGADAGRVFLDSEAAWKHGFSQQVGRVRQKFREFWSDTFDILKKALPVYKPEGRQVIPIVTIAN